MSLIFLPAHPIGAPLEPLKSVFASGRHDRLLGGRLFHHGAARNAMIIQTAARFPHKGHNLAFVRPRKPVCTNVSPEPAYLGARCQCSCLCLSLCLWRLLLANGATLHANNRLEFGVLVGRFVRARFYCEPIINPLSPARGPTRAQWRLRLWGQPGHASR